MSTSIILIYKIIAFSTLGLGLYLALLVLISDSKKTINRFYLFMIIAQLPYVLTPYLANLPEFSNYSLWLIKLAYAIALFGGLSGYFIAINLLPEQKRKYKILSIFSVIVSLFGFFIGLSPFFIKGLEATEWGFSPIFRGTLIRILYFSSIGFFLFVSPFLLIKNYSTASSEEKSRYLYFLIGFISNYFLFGGIFLVLLPSLGYPAAQFYALGILGVTFLYVFTAIGIIKKGTFGVKFILPQILGGLINVFILILFFIEKNFILKIVNAVIFIFVLFVNTLLMGSVQREIREKEKNKQLSDKLLNLNKVLEDRIKERTKELELSKQELEKKVQELEKWYKLTIGRELRMVELKQKIKEKEEEVKKITGEQL